MADTIFRISGTSLRSAPAGGVLRRGGVPQRARAAWHGPAAQAILETQGGDGMTGEDVMVQNAETEHLRQQLLQAQRLSSMGALASSVAHEFNNILTTIINYAKLGLRSEGDEPTRVQSFERVLKASLRAATIINSMLGFARNTATQREMTDLAGLVEEVLLLTSKDLSKHQVRVETKFLSRPVAPVVRGQIEQILINLLINARQAMPRGGHLRIEVRE